MANSGYATSCAAAFVKAKACSEWIEMFCKVPIGATGAVGTLVKDAPIDVTRDSTGVYSITFPKAADACVRVAIVSPLSTVIHASVTATDGQAGTASFTTSPTGGTATDPASGDVLRIFIKARVKL